MNRQERELIDELFDRLASLENQPRDQEAVAAINEGLRRAPHALYPLVQTVLLQDEALKAANARIEQLEGIAPAEPREQRSFLDSMRDSLFGREESRGSVPQVRPGDRPMGSPWGGGRDPGYGQGQPAGYGQPQGYAQEPSRGGSFLGTAAAAAAGVLGGALLMNGIRSVLGGSQGPFQGAFDQLSGGSSGAPWGGGGGSGDLARDAGLGDIGSSRSAGLFGGGESERTGLFGGGSESHTDDASDFGGEDSDFGDDGGFDSSDA